MSKLRRRKHPAIVLDYLRLHGSSYFLKLTEVRKKFNLDHLYVDPEADFFLKKAAPKRGVFSFFFYVEPTQKSGFSTTLN